MNTLVRRRRPSPSILATARVVLSYTMLWGHPAQERKGGNVSVTEGLGGLGRVGLHIAPIAVRKVHGQVVGLLLRSTDDHPRFAKVTLGMSRGMGQWYEHLSGPTTAFPDVVLDDCVLARKPVLVPQPLIDTLGGVTLLLRNSLVFLEDLVDHALVWVQLRSTRRSVSLIPWRYRVLEHLAHRVPVQSVYPRSLSSAHPFYKASPANSQVHLHLVHPIHLQSGSVVPD